MIKILKKIKSSSENHVDRYILAEVKRVDGKFDILEKLAVLNAKNSKSIIEDKIYPVMPKNTLEELIEDLNIKVVSDIRIKRGEKCPRS